MTAPRRSLWAFGLALRYLGATRAWHVYVVSEDER